MPPLHFRRRPPQSNYPPDTVFLRDDRQEVRILNMQGWYFNDGSPHTGVQGSTASHLSLHMQAQKSNVKL